MKIARTQTVSVLFKLFLLAACLGGVAACATIPPAGPTPLAGSAPAPALMPTVTAATPGAPTPAPGFTSAPAPTVAGETPLPPTPTPAVLVICQKEEPLSLYLYGDNTAARAGIFEALFDGPIDSTGYAYQPVILEFLPSLENGGMTYAEVEVRPGDRVVDAVTGAVVRLGEGVHLAQADGSQVLYSGDQPARALQISAVFKLKAGLLWSDGQPLTADDSLFSFEVASSPDTPTSKIFVDRTARYEAVDGLSLRWTGLPGWLDTNYFLRFWTPLPRHLYGALSAADLYKNPEAAQRPLGWGAFQLEEWRAGEQLTLTRNPHYFQAAEGLPHLDQVVFRFGLEGAQILAELQAGRCHIGEEAASWAEQLPALLAARGAGWLAPQFVPDTAFEHLDFGIAPEAGYKRAAGVDLFQEVSVRQAFAYCLDRQALVNQLLYGLAEVPGVYVSAQQPLYAKGQVVQYRFDPARGQSLLEAAGWADRDGDGIREKGSRKLTLEYAELENDAFRGQLSQLVQAQLRQNCGIDAQVKTYPPEVLYDVWPQGVLFGRKFDLGGFSWRAGIDPPCNLYTSDAIPSSAGPGATGANDTGYSSAAFDRACHAALTALDEPTRRAMHAQAQAIFSQDLPSLPLFFLVKAGAAAPNVRGYQLDSTAQSDLWNIEQMSLGR